MFKPVYCGQRIVDFVEKCSDVLFAIRLLFYGLDVYVEAHRFVVKFFQILWPLCFISLMIDRTAEAFTRLSSPFVSCIDLAMILNKLLTSWICALIYRNFFHRREFFQTTLRSRPINRQHSTLNSSFFSLYLFGLILIVLPSIEQITLCKLLLGCVAFHIWLSMFAFFGVYIQLTAILRDQLAELLEQMSSRRNRIHVDKLIVARWGIRDLTLAINKNCGLVMLLFYLKTFSLVVHFAGKLIYSSIGRPFMGIIICHAVYLLQMHFVVSEASKINAYCDLIDRETYRTLSKLDQRLERRELQELREVLPSRSVWDSLKMAGGFSVSTQSYYQFLATCVSCVAIILQFDSKVMFSLMKATDYISARNVNKE